MRRAGVSLGAAILLFLCVPRPAYAQEKEQALSDAEVEKLRDTAYEPPSRVLAFMGFLDQRTRQLASISVGKRRPGREEDIHDQIEQFTSIADDFDDNLEDYGKRHLDVRKVLPKVVAACERWATEIKTPPDHEAYTVSRKLALETLTDLRMTATRLIEEQKAWFLTHPPTKEGAPPAPPPRL